MSEESLAHKSQPSVSSDAEYDLIHGTLSETAQGRRFLEEYARRCGPADAATSLAAIERMQAVIRDGGTSERMQLLLEMADMAQAIVRLRAEVLAMRPPGSGPLEATEELDSIVQTTESATSRILAAAENVQEIAWTLRDSGSIKALCDELDAQATEVYTACSFQDLTGQRTRKVIEVLRYLENRINAVVAAQSEGERREEKSPSDNLQQADVDAMMQPEGSAQDQSRQDATLEDISRVMLEIEPAIGQPEPVAQSKPRFEEVRPQLSVTETIIAEAEAARKLIDWVVDAPAEQAAENGLVDWVVEDPQAPRPEAEPAWMILRRLETERDEKPEQPAPKAPSRPATAEPGLFVAEAMSQLAQELRPVSLLPPAELSFRSKLPQAEPLAALAGAMATQEMKLAVPGDETHEAAAPAPEPTPPEASDPDDFLFASEEKMIADAGAPPAESKPDSAAAKPKQETPPQSASHAQEQAKAPDYDPLSPLRAMSDAQKIALFS